MRYLYLLAVLGCGDVDIDVGFDDLPMPLREVVCCDCLASGACVPDRDECIDAMWHDREVQLDAADYDACLAACDMCTRL